MVNATPRPLYSREYFNVHDAGWAQGPVCRGTEILALPEFDPRTDHTVPNRFTDSHVLSAHMLKRSILRNKIAVSGEMQILAACKLRCHTIQAMYVSVTFRYVRATIVAVEKQKVLHILSIRL